MPKKEFTTEEVPCPLCSSENNSSFGSAKDRLRVTDDIFTFARCADCGLVFQNPRVTQNTVGIFYPDNYFKIRPGRASKKYHTAQKKVIRKRRLVEKYAPKRGRILEIGSANGDFLVEMRKSGWDVQGVEISKDGADFSRKEHGLKVFNGNLGDRPDDGTRFQVVVMWAVLPHLSNPLCTVSYIEKVLAEDGKFICCCANIDSYAAKKMKNNWGHFDLPRHYCLWSPGTLKKLYERFNFDIEKINYHEDIFKSNLKLPFLPSLFNIGRSKYGISGFCFKVIRKVSAIIHNMLTNIILFFSCKLQQGGIITVVGVKRLHRGSSQAIDIKKETESQYPTIEDE